MIRHAFQHRSGRVIALGRGTLATFFLLAAWLDPAGSTRLAGITRVLLMGYAAFALAILLMTWNSWIWESRLSAATHIVDIIVFAVLVALTEGYVSPYFTFFVFLILSAAIRWSWSVALLTGLFVVMIYLSAGYSASGGETAPFDVPRFVVRGANLFVLSLMIAWFGLNQAQRGGKRGERLETEAARATSPPMKGVLKRAAAKLGARRVLFAWSDTEEPWLHVWSFHDGRVEKTRFGPEQFPNIVSDELSDSSFLFNLRAGNALKSCWRQAPFVAHRGGD